jgi:hypothetical protein
VWSEIVILMALLRYVVGPALVPLVHLALPNQYTVCETYLRARHHQMWDIDLYIIITELLVFSTHDGMKIASVV